MSECGDSRWDSSADGAFASLGGGSDSWTPYVGPALVGTVLGLLLGAVLWMVNVRASGRPGDRMARVVLAGMAGAVVGLSPALFLVGAAFRGDALVDGPPLGVYAISAVLSYALALVAIFGVLHLSRDPATRRTVRSAAAMLPIGALAATAAGVGVAALQDFRTTAPTWITVVMVVMSVLAAALVAARSWALRPVRM